MGDETREARENLREEWAEHPQTAALGAQGHMLYKTDGGELETPEERMAREGAPAATGPSLDELIAKERPPIVTDFTRGALAEHARHEEEHEGAQPDEG
jgi:hypothetical protein